MSIKRYHLYVGVDYAERLDVVSSEMRRRFSNDAEEVRQLLSDAATYPDTLDGPVRASHFKDAVRRALDESNVGRAVMIYFAGHAQPEDDRIVLVMSDSEPGNLGVDTYWLLEQVNSATAPSEVAVILDCCYSGCPGELRGGRYWLGAAPQETKSTNEFHSQLVSCLSEFSADQIELQQMHSRIVQSNLLIRPVLSGNFSGPVILRTGRTMPRSRNAAELERMSAASLSARGRLRTAFPTDLSFSELRAERIFIPPRFRRSQIGEGADLDVTRLTQWVAAGRSILILGEPGAGKSFASYLCQAGFHESGHPAIAADVSTLTTQRKISQHAEDLDVDESAQHPAESPDLIHSTGGAAIAILDGLDEVVSESADPRKIDDLLRGLGRNTGYIAFCRREEYETVLYRIIQPANFDYVLSLLPWTFDDFASYVELLATRGFPQAGALRERVRNDPELTNLVTRPLHARMLAFVWSRTPNAPDTFDAPASLADLYQRYLTALAHVHAGRLQRVYSEDTFGPGDVIADWQQLAWRAFREHMLYSGSLTETSIGKLTRNKSEIRVAAMRGILQVPTGIPGGDHSFLHYSFYEFLVAQTLVRQLLAAYDMGDYDLGAAVLEVDLPRPERHFAISLARREPISTDDGFATFLARLFHAQTDGSGNHPRKSTRQNLICYLLSRLDPPSAGEVVVTLLNDVTEDFVRTSLYWAGCHLGATEVLEEYLAVLSDNPVLGEYNRGYLMYYYGDSDRRADPPYLDADPLQPWGRTRVGTMAMMAEPTYTETSVERVALDVYTFLDSLRFRGEKATRDEQATLVKQIDKVTKAFASGPEVAVRLGNLLSTVVDE